jgi:hypothetical protein
MIQILPAIKRKLLFNRDRISFFKHLSEQAYQQSLQQHINHLPLLSDQDQAIVNELQHYGIVVTSLDQLEISLTPQLLADAAETVSHLAKISLISKKQYLIKASSKLLLQYPSLFRWGAETKLLNLIENYLGLPVAYHGVYFRRDLANNVKKKTRLWHLDKEDRKMFKIIIYLGDVCSQSGCFQYIPKCLTNWICHHLKYNYGKISDQAIEDLVPRHFLKSCIGQSGTVILVDTAQVFHRGKIPTISDRFSIFFDYTSRIPKHPYYCKSCCQFDELIQLSNSLNKQAKNCIFWR